MPNPMAIGQSIRSRIKTLVIDPHPEIEWIFRDEVQREPTPTRSQVIIDLVIGRTRQASTGSPRLFRTRGSLTFRISTSMVDGRGVNEQIAEEIIHPHFLAIRAGDPPVLYLTPAWTPSEVPDEQWFVGRSVVEWTSDFNAP